MYDVYLELIDGANFVRSLFQSSQKQSGKQDTKVASQQLLKRAPTKIAEDDEDGSGTIEGRLEILHQYKRRIIWLFEKILFCIFYSRLYQLGIISQGS